MQRLGLPSIALLTALVGSGCGGGPAAVIKPDRSASDKWHCAGNDGSDWHCSRDGYPELPQTNDPAPTTSASEPTPLVDSPFPDLAPTDDIFADPIILVRDDAGSSQLIDDEPSPQAAEVAKQTSAIAPPSQIDNGVSNANRVLQLAAFVDADSLTALLARDSLQQLPIARATVNSKGQLWQVAVIEGLTLDQAQALAEQINSAEPDITPWIRTARDFANAQVD